MHSPIAIDFPTIVKGHYDARTFSPARWEIPAEFTQPGNAWAVAASHLMWLGAGAVTRAEPKPGVDTEEALLHVAAVLHARNLPIEHREAAAAYLLSGWFNCIELAGGGLVGCAAQDDALGTH